MAPQTAQRSPPGRDISKILGPEVYAVLLALQDETSKYFTHPSRRSQASLTSAPADSGRKKVVTKIRVDELSTLQEPHASGNTDRIKAFATPFDMIKAVPHTPAGSWNCSFATTLDAALRTYGRDDFDDELLYWRP